jgi:hypothetical protein
MASEISSILEDLIKQIFPQNSRINLVENGGNLIIKIAWTITDDIDRPSKPSRKIEIVIDNGILNDYLNKNPDKQAKDIANFKKFIEQKYKLFNPEPETPRFSSPPTEQWVITDNILNS